MKKKAVDSRLNCRFNGIIEEDGDYRICFDNRNSRWSDKTVWFEVQVEDPEDDYDDDYIDTDEWDKMKELNEDTMSMFEMKVDDIKTMLHTIRLKINKIRHFFFMHSGSMSKVKRDDWLRYNNNKYSLSGHKSS